MLDGRLKKAIDPWLEKIAIRLVENKISANIITLAGFGLALVAAIAVSQTYFLVGLFFILISRLCDGLDGAVARATKPTDFGGLLDIVLDFAFYGLIPLAFILANPQQNGVAGGVLLLSFYVNGASFLAFAVVAEKRDLQTQARGKKSIYFTTGLAEASETLFVFISFCLFPSWFAVIAYAFAAICFYTTLSRIIEARKSFTN